MSDQPNASGPGADAPAEKKPLPKWKLGLFVVAGLLLVAGGVLYAMDGGSPPAPSPGVQPGGVAGAGLVELGGSGGGAAAGSESSWAPGLLKMGFSFFVAFAIGSVFRSFFKLSVLFVGVLALLLIGLQQGGFLTIHWNEFEGLWSNFTARVEDDFAQLRTMITGSLPQTGLAGMGLFAGFKKG